MAEDCAFGDYMPVGLSVDTMTTYCARTINMLKRATRNSVMADCLVRMHRTVGASPLGGTNDGEGITKNPSYEKSRL